MADNIDNPWPDVNLYYIDLSLKIIIIHDKKNNTKLFNRNKSFKLKFNICCKLRS